jgi:hypothetical protein
VKVRIVTRNTAHQERFAMTVHYTLMSHGTVLGHTGATFPPDELPAGAHVWHFVPSAAFDVIEPIIAELTAPPALSLVEEVIPTQDAYLHPARKEHEAQMERLTREAERIHHFRLVLERYESLDLELREATGRRVATTTLIVTKQLVPSAALRAYVEAVDPPAAQWVDALEPCYLLMARLATLAAASAA